MLAYLRCKHLVWGFSTVTIKMYKYYANLLLCNIIYVCAALKTFWRLRNSFCVTRLHTQYDIRRINISIWFIKGLNNYKHIDIVKVGITMTNLVLCIYGLYHVFNLFDTEKILSTVLPFLIERRYLTSINLCQSFFCWRRQRSGNTRSQILLSKPKQKILSF